jgi:hypothetical protein
MGYPIGWDPEMNIRAAGLIWYRLVTMDRVALITAAASYNASQASRGRDPNMGVGHIVARALSEV